MQVSMRVGDNSLWLGNKGIVFYIADESGKHVGKLRIGQAKIEWCSGKTRIGNGKKLTLRRFINEFENL